MNVTEFNVRYLEPWTIHASRNKEKVFCLFTIGEKGQVQMYNTDEVAKEHIIKQLRHIADELEKKGKIIAL